MHEQEKPRNTKQIFQSHIFNGKTKTKLSFSSDSGNSTNLLPSAGKTNKNIVLKVKGRRTLSTEFGKYSMLHFQTFRVRPPIHNGRSHQQIKESRLPSSPLSFVPIFTFEALSLSTVLLETNWDSSCWTSFPASKYWL